MRTYGCGLGLVVALVLTGSAGGDMLSVFNVNDAGGLDLVVSSDLGVSVNAMTKETGAVMGDGFQYVILHEGGTLRGYTIRNGAIVNDLARESDAPDILCTGGNMNPDISGEDMPEYFKYRDDIGWHRTGDTYMDTRAYTAIDTIENARLGAMAMKTLGVQAIAMGFGEMNAGNPGDELNMYGVSAGNGSLYGLANTSSGSFSAVNYRAATVWNNANLMDLHRIKMSLYNPGGDDFMCSFDSSGSFLVVWSPRTNGSFTVPAQQGVSVNPGQSNEALFLQVGNVNAYQATGPEEAVIYRKDGSVEAWSAQSNGSMTSVLTANIGTGVTAMLIGDVLGDSLEELVVAKGNFIEVWDLSNGTAAALQASYTVPTELRKLAVGNLDGIGKADIIVLTVPPPTPTPIPGDANRDTIVTFEDFAALQNHYGQSVTGDAWTQGDFTGDNVVNFADFAILQNHYGQSSSPAEAPAAQTAGTPCGLPALVLLGLILIGLGGLALKSE